MDRENTECLINKMLDAVSADALLLTSPPNMRYTAGFTGEGYVYVSRRQRIVATDSRYTIAAAAECPGFSVVKWSSGEYYGPLAEAVHSDRAAILGFEDRQMTVAGYSDLCGQLEKAGLRHVETRKAGNLVSDFRRVKDEREIQWIREAESIGDRAFARILTALERGMTEKQVAARLEYFMKEEGAEGFSFDTIAASGAHSAMPHAVPTDKVLEEGDFLTLDFGCIWKGYCSDMTRTVVVGNASQKQRKVYNTVLRAQKTALEGIRPGMTGIEVDALARDVIRSAGYGEYFGHSLGHSVGLEIHESPAFSEREDTVIQPGMVITVEPGIYIEGFGGVRIEDVVVITEDGCENITHSPKELIELG